MSDVWYWRYADCGYIHEYGVCDNDHPWVDTQITGQGLSVGSKPAIALGQDSGQRNAGTVDDVIRKLRQHRLVTYLPVGMVSCECGHICALSWYTEHIIEEVTKK